MQNWYLRFPADYPQQTDCYLYDTINHGIKLVAFHSKKENDKGRVCQSSFKKGECLVASANTAYTVRFGSLSEIWLKSPNLTQILS